MRGPRKSAPGSPIEKLMALMHEHSKKPFKADPEFLSYMLATKGITPDYLFQLTDCDEVRELAEQIHEDTAAMYAGRRRK